MFVTTVRICSFVMSPILHDQLSKNCFKLAICIQYLHANTWHLVLDGTVEYGWAIFQYIANIGKLRSCNNDIAGIFTGQ